VDLRSKIIDRWTELEMEKVSIKIPKTYAEALRLAADQAELLELQAPKVEAYEKLMKTEKDMSITEASKHFMLHPKLDVFPYLREHGYLTSKDLPTMYAIEMDVLSLRQSQPDRYGKTHSQAIVKACQLPRFKKLVADKLGGE